MPSQMTLYNIDNSILKQHIPVYTMFIYHHNSAYNERAADLYILP